MHSQQWLVQVPKYFNTMWKMKVPKYGFHENRNKYNNMDDS